MISIAQMNVHAGQPEKNLRTILDGIAEAGKIGSDVVVFPELAVPGYLLGDEWENEAFVRECESMNAEIIAATKTASVTAIWGNVKTDSTRKNEDGRLRKYNAGFVARNGIFVPGGLGDGSIVKTLMPNYREFRDKRHFVSLQQVAFEDGKTIGGMSEYYQPFELVVDGVKRKVGVIICEDLWDDDYAVKPVQMFRTNGADILVNISASPFGIGKQAKRDRLLARQSEGLDIVYLNHVGAQNNGKNVFVFDGASTAYRNGKKVFQALEFKSGIFGVTGLERRNSEDCETSSWILDTVNGYAIENPAAKLSHDSENRVYETKIQTVVANTPSSISLENPASETSQIAAALTVGLRDFMENIGQKKIVIGLSGGIDSAVVATLSVLAVGRENVIAINMPSEFNSETTKGFAKRLADQLGIRYEIMSIQASVEYTRSQIEQTLGVSTDGLVSENIQARDRGSRVLAGVAASLGAVFTNNGNKTEVSQGYATLYGDVNGSIAPIADLYKTQVFALARYLAEKHGLPVLAEICDIPPSAELSADQAVDEGKGDPFVFEYHDKLIYQFIESRKDPADILAGLRDGNLEKMLGTAKPVIGPEGYFPTVQAFIADVERIWKNYKLSYFKRVQAPPILTVSRRSFGYDLEESQNWVYYTREYAKLKSELFSK